MSYMLLKNRTLDAAGRAMLILENWKIRGISAATTSTLMLNLTLALVLFLCNLMAAPAAKASASSIYIAQSAAGAANGADCADAFAVSFFNNSANWGSGGNQIGAGTTVYLCGTFNGAAGSSLLTFQGNGSSGNPITLQFETGADLTAPYWSTSGAINVGSHSQIVIDGGSNGIIQATANGTTLGNQQTNSGITTFGGNVEIRHLTIANLYVHSSTSDSGVDQTGVNCISFSGSSVLIHDNIMHDAGWCLYENSNAGDANVSIYNNTIYNIDHGWALAPYGHTGSSGPFSFYSNTVYGYSVWDTQSDAYHHDGIHCYTSGTGGVAEHITALNIYNNLFEGPVGGNWTAHIFIEGNPGSGTPCMDTTSISNIYNNVFIADQPGNNGLLGFFSGTGNIYNNTFIGSGTSSGVVFAANNAGVGSVTFENNVMTTGNQLIAISNNIKFTTDYNIYANGGSNSFVCNGNFYNTNQFSSWQGCIGGDSHSSYAASAGLSSAGVPQAGSAVIGAGINLTSIGIPALDWDTTDGDAIVPVQRPATGSWDVSAYLFGTGGVGAPNAPSGLIATVN
jgi:hypothetical protein